MTGSMKSSDLSGKMNQAAGSQQDRMGIVSRLVFPYSATGEEKINFLYSSALGLSQAVKLESSEIQTGVMPGLQRGIEYLRESYGAMLNGKPDTAWATLQQGAEAILAANRYAASIQKDLPGLSDVEVAYSGIKHMNGLHTIDLSKIEKTLLIGSAGLVCAGFLSETAKTREM